MSPPPGARRKKAARRRPKRAGRRSSPFEIKLDRLKQQAAEAVGHVFMTSVEASRNGPEGYSRDDAVVSMMAWFLEVGILGLRRQFQGDEAEFRDAAVQLFADTLNGVLGEERASVAAKAEHRPSRVVRRDPDGSRVIDLGTDAQKVMEDALLRFKQKFGREPAKGEPLVYFDPDADTPQPMSEEQIQEEIQLMVSLMKEADFPPEYIHAYIRTGGLLINEENQHLVSAEDMREWEEAHEEYFEWQRLADGAQERGLPPAIVFAVRKSGVILRREDVHVDEDGVHVHDEQRQLFLDALAEYGREHPQEVTPQFLRAWLKKGDSVQ